MNEAAGPTLLEAVEALTEPTMRKMLKEVDHDHAWMSVKIRSTHCS